jgi:hypothetical protein
LRVKEVQTDKKNRRTCFNSLYQMRKVRSNLK